MENKAELYFLMYLWESHFEMLVQEEGENIIMQLNIVLAAKTLQE